MNEITTEVKAKEIHEKAVGYFKISEQYGYKFIMEVKKIRDDRYYKELGFDTFEDYCQNAWGFSRRWVNAKIQSASNLSEEDFGNFNSQYGGTKTFLLATMEDEQREQATEKGIPTDEGYKSINKATQKEINEYKRNAEEAEQRAIKFEQAKQQLEQQLKEEQNKPPKTIEKEKIVEVDNTDYDQIEHLKRSLEESNNKQIQLENELNQIKQNSEEYLKVKDNLENLYRQSEDMEEQIKSATSISELVVEVEQFVQESIGKVLYSRAAKERIDSYIVKENIEYIGKMLVDAGEDILNLLPKSKYDNNIIEL